MKNSKMKFGFSHLRKSTPTWLNRIGIALTAVSLFMLASPYLIDMPVYVGQIGFWMGAAGVFLTQMFTNEEK